MKAAFEQFDADGLEFGELKVGEVSPVYQSDDGKVVFVEYSVTAKAGENRGLVNGFYVAVGDVGKWKFLDSNGISKNPKILEVLVPGLDPDVPLPEHSARRLPE